MESKNTESYDPWVMRLALIIVLIPIICFALWLLALQYWGILLVPEVQAAVDAQCGAGNHIVEWQEIGGDPILYWSNGIASCDTAHFGHNDSFTGRFRCSCGQ